MKWGCGCEWKVKVEVKAVGVVGSTTMPSTRPNILHIP